MNRSIVIATVLTTLLAMLAGCGVNPHDIGREPHMTPVGSGLKVDRAPIVTAAAVTPVRQPGHSFWQDSSADLFRDPRAMKIGDVMTVKISIKDKASIDNTSDRKRDSTWGLGFDSSFSGTGAIIRGTGNGQFDAAVDAKTSTKSEGAIARSESINLLVAAVVTDVLPNGNMMITGTQEVRVNYEVRVLQVAGIVRPRDIATDNSVSYDKIAEARISYGGRGRIMEVQQPGWGHQIVDVLTPF